jgi:hypothetical protein
VQNIKSNNINADVFGGACSTQDRRNASLVTGEKRNGKSVLTIPWCKFKDNIKMYLK